MKNISMEVEGHILTVKIDLSKDFGPSATGKTTIVASTEGNQSIDGFDGFKVGVNVFKRPK